MVAGGIVAAAGHATVIAGITAGLLLLAGSLWLRPALRDLNPPAAPPE